MPKPHAPLTSTLAAERDPWSIADRLDQIDISVGDRAFIETFFAAHSCRSASETSYMAELRLWAVSGYDYLSFGEVCFGYRLRNGTLSLISAILADGGSDLRLGAAVDRIESGADEVQVTTARGEQFVARADTRHATRGVAPPDNRSSARR